MKLRQELQIFGVEFHIADFFYNDFLHFIAVLLLLLTAMLLRVVSTSKSILHVTQRLDGLLLTLVTNLPWLLPAILGIAVFLSFLWSCLHLKLTNFFRLKVTILLLHRERKDVRELLAVPVDVGLTHLDLNLSRDIVTVLLGSPLTDDLLLTVPIILSRLFPLAIKYHSVSACDIINCLFFHKAVGSLDIATLVVVFRSCINVIRGITHTIFACEASLYLIGFLESLVMNGFHQTTNQLIYIKTHPLDICLNNSRAVLELCSRTLLLVSCPASFLRVGLALVLEHNFFNLVTVGVLINTISSNIGLSNIRIVWLNWRWCRILGRWWRRSITSTTWTLSRDYIS